VEQTNGAAMKWKRGRTSILFWRSSWRRWKEEDRSSHSPERRGHNNRIQRSTERCLCSLSLSLSNSLSLCCCLSLRSHALSLFTFNYFLSSFICFISSYFLLHYCCYCNLVTHAILSH